jgi:hypothetical protein
MDIAQLDSILESCNWDPEAVYHVINAKRNEAKVTLTIDAIVGNVRARISKMVDPKNSISGNFLYSFVFYFYI